MKTVLIGPLSASSFQPVAGLPLIQRIALSALRSGFERIIVVAEGDDTRARALLTADQRLRAVEVSRDLPALDETQVTVVRGDCVVTSATLQRVNEVILDGRPMLFGSAGRETLALCRPAMLAGTAGCPPTAGGIEGLWAALRARGTTGAIAGEVCVPVGDPQSVALAERTLCARLRADSAASDGPLAHWIDRWISLRISRWLVRHTRLRPNHITIIGTSIGLCAAALLSAGTYWAGVAGTLLFLCATVVDGCDGEVARLTFQESSFGQKFDVITDNVVHVAIFVGLALGQYRQNPGGHSLLLLAILLGGFASTSAVTYFFLVRRPGFAASGGIPVSYKGRIRQGLLRGFEVLMNRDFAYLLLALAVVNRLSWFLWGTAFGTYVFSIALICIYRWRDAA